MKTKRLHFVKLVLQNCSIQQTFLNKLYQKYMLSSLVIISEERAL